VRFAERPVRAFLRQRLGISAGARADEVEDALSVELDPLGVWGVGQRLLDARLAGAEARGAILAEIARGTLPPGVLGKPVVDRVVPIVEEIVRHAPAGESGSIDVRVALGAGRALSGTVAGVSGDVLRTVTYSRVSARHRLAAWVRLLALAAADPERPFAAETIGRVRADAEQGRVTIARLTRPADPLRELAVLVDLYDRGMREPLPLACLTSAAYVQGGEPAARAAWESTWNFDKEDSEPEHQLVLGGVLDFAELLAEPPRAGEDFGDPSRFGGYARRLWTGLLAHERLVEA